MTANRYARGMRSCAAISLGFLFALLAATGLWWSGHESDVTRGEIASPTVQAPDPSAGERLVAESENATAPVTLQNRTNAATGPLHPFDGARLIGRVTSSAGSTLQFAQVVVEAESGEVRAGLDDQGLYETETLPIGSWSVRVEQRVHRTARFTIDVIGDSESIIRDVVLEPRRVVSVRLLDGEGAPFDQRLYAEWGIDSWDEPEIAVTRVDPRPLQEDPRWDDRDVRELASGWFERRSDDGAGLYGVLTLIEGEGHWAVMKWNRRILATQRIHAVQDHVTFVISPDLMREGCAIVRGRLTDAGGSVPQGAEVKLSATGGSLHLEVDETGAFESDCVEPGERSLTIEAPACAVVRRSLRLHAGEDLDLGSLALSPPTRVSGVVERHGPDVEGRVRVVMRRVDGAGPSESYRTVAELGGTFVFEGVELANYAVSVRHLDLAADSVAKQRLVSELVAADATAGPVEGLVLRPVAPTVLQLTFDGRRALPMPVCVIRDAAGLPVDVVNLMGTARAVELTPGAYTLECRNGEATAETSAIVGEDGGEAVVTIPR